MGLGYRFGDRRIEGKIMYGRFDAASIRFAEGEGTLSGYFDLRGAALELFYDLPVNAKVRPYLGAGIGGVSFHAKNVTLAGFPPTVGETTLLTQQLVAGITYAIEPWRLVVGYRWMEMGEQDYETGGVPLRGKPIRTRAIQGGVQFDF